MSEKEENKKTLKGLAEYMKTHTKEEFDKLTKEVLKETLEADNK